MAEKTKIKPDQIMAQDGKNVTYMDEGGTLRRSPKSQVEIVSPDAGAEEPAPVEQFSDEAPEAAGEEAPPPGTDPGTDEGSPPSSDTSPEAPAPKPPKQARKKTMATAAPATAAKKKVAPPKKVPAKVAAKKAPKTESSGVRTIGGKAVDLSGYNKVKTAAGGTSYNNGDAVAEKLEGKTLDEAYDIAARVLKVDAKELRKKYGHLNTGMQRMSLGNRMRSVMIPKAAKN